MPEYPDDHRHDICITTNKGRIGDIYNHDLYEVADTRQTLAGTIRCAIKYGAKRPTII